MTGFHTPSFVVCIILITLIYGSLIYTIPQLRRFKSLMDMGSEFFQTRHPMLIISYIIGFLTIFYILNPLILVLSNILNIPSTICIYLITLNDILISFLIFPKALIHCFDRSFVDNLRNWVWRREINPRDTSFSIKYRAILQYAHFIILLVYIIVILPILITLHSLSNMNNTILAHIALIIVLCIMYTVTLYSAKQINTVTDEYAIKQEVVDSVTTTGAFYIATEIIYQLLCYFTNYKWSVIIQIVLNSVVCIFALYYACMWTINKYLFQTLLMGTSDNKRRKNIRLQHIMDHRNGAESFCNHLSREFGLESILFLIEVTQFKAVIHALKRTIPDNIAELCRINHSDTFSVSILNIRWLPIDPRMYTQTPYQLALLLYDKYIDESADLCINISYMNRNTLYRDCQTLALKHMDHKDLNTQRHHFEDMYTIFDHAFTEIWRLISMDSYRRYLSTDECERLIDILFQDDIQDEKPKSKTKKLVVTMKQSIKYIKQDTTSPNSSTPMGIQTPTTSEVKEEMEMEMEAQDVMDAFKDVFEVDPLGIVQVPQDVPNGNMHTLPPNTQLIHLGGSQSQPNPTNRSKLTLPSLQLQPSSVPPAFAEQNVAQRAARLKGHNIRSRASSLILPRPTTYRYMIKTESLKADPNKPGRYYIKSNSETNHLTKKSVSLMTIKHNVEMND